MVVAENPAGLPWGGSGTILSAMHDIELAKRGRFLGHARQARPPAVPAGGGAESRSHEAHQDLPCLEDVELARYSAMSHDQMWRFRVAKPPAATMRRIYRGPSPSWESHGYVGQLQYPEQIAETLPGVPDAKTRLPTPEAKVCPRSRPCSAPAPAGGVTRSPLEGPGFTRRQWRSEFFEDGAVGLIANSRSPRFAPARYGACIVRQQRLAGTACSLKSSRPQSSRCTPRSGRSAQSSRLGPRAPSPRAPSRAEQDPGVTNVSNLDDEF